MKKMLLLAVTLLQMAGIASAQKYITKNGVASFFSATPAQNIEAVNRQVVAIIDPAKHTVAVSMLLKGFLFQKDLMQQHFNENYVESDKYPKATFTGTFTGNLHEGKNVVTISGNLTLHGVTKPVTAKAVITLSGNTLNGDASFNISPEDFRIQIPSIVKDKIARSVSVKVSLNCKS